MANVIPDSVMRVGSTLSFQLTDHFSDPDEDDLTFTASSPDTTVVRVVVDETELSIEALTRGTAVVRVIATDPDSHSVSHGFYISVLP